MALNDTHALVLFSGGQDSTACLAWALNEFEHVETVGFDYGQRHAIEVECRPKVIQAMRKLNPVWDERLGMDHVLDLNVLGQISETSLTRDTEITMNENGLPSSFVPGRNLIFLNFAGAIAYRRGLGRLVGGMCETDFSGYPDCRNETMKVMTRALSLGMDENIEILTPLMWINKSETWTMCEDLAGKPFIDLVIEETHTCYFGERGNRHDWGYGCGECPACELRKNGWTDYNA